MQKNSPSPHSQFFSSLRQVEKRLKLEESAQQSFGLSPPPLILPGENHENTEQTDSLGTPIYLNYKHPAPATEANISTLQESEVPREFLTDSTDFPPIHRSPPEENRGSAETTVDHDERSNLGDDIELLMQLLQLSDSGEQIERVNLINVGCDDGFYRKIAGLKGPKSLKELERLEGWIKHFLNSKERKAFVLTHLLLAKAAIWHSDDSCDGFGGLEFPSTIDEFLEKDPPLD